MDDRVITSTANPFVKRLRALEQRKHREAEGAFFVEGIRPVWQAVQARARVDALVVAPDLLTSELAQGLVRAQRESGTRVVHVSGPVFESIAEREHPSGLGALVRISPLILADLVIQATSFFIALQDVGNPGNLGTIIRTVDGAGGSGVILIGQGTDPYHPTAVKASMGTLFTVPVARADSLNEVLEWCSAQAVKVVTTSSRARQSYWSVIYPRPALFLFGSEGAGLHEQEFRRGDLAVRIPMAGAADSLNLAVSVGVLLYEVKRQVELES